ncbi:MAG: hypothetical protein HYZ28_26125 [Myxococcales bacterium]|nr:hypothetical protein [Myxococcales bacterium]
MSARLLLRAAFLFALAGLATFAVRSSPSWAMDPPHWAGTELDFSCKSCHTFHNAPGMTLTSVAGNANLCQSCHVNRPGADAGTGIFGFPWTSGDQAVPGSQGKSHRWDAVAENPDFGAKAPLDLRMSKRIEGGKISCSVCHDQHNGATLNSQGASQYTSYAAGDWNAPLGFDAGTDARLSLQTPAAGSNAKAYQLKVVTGGGVGTARFVLSNDNGRSWFGWILPSGPWDSAVSTGKLTAASNVELNDSPTSNVKVGFSGTMAVGDQWRFYLSYPMLRIRNDASQLCEECHRERVMDAGMVECCGDGGFVFSHPVGVPLSGPSIRDGGSILDVNGMAQDAGGDSKGHNDLRLDPNGLVRCMTCHYPHGADSNSQTEDS